MLEKVFYGNTVENWLVSLAIVVIAIVVCKLISILNRRVIIKILSKTNNRYDDILFKSLEAPFLLGLMLLAIWIAFSRLHFETNVTSIISKSYKVLTVLNVTWFIARFITALLNERVRRNFEKHHEVSKLMPLVKRGVVIIIWTIGFVMALNNVGVSVTALLGTLGIGGIAFALAAQDTVKNIIGGITLLSDGTVKIGDRIKFDAIDGNVEDIGLRSTKIRTLDKRIVTIPNYRIVDASIESVSSEPGRRVVMKIGLTYNTTPEKMKVAIDILKDIPKEINEIDSKDLSATFSDFSDFALIITFIYFVNKKSPDLMESISKVNFLILEKYNNLKLEFAFPSQTLYFQSADSTTQEILSASGK